VRIVELRISAIVLAIAAASSASAAEVCSKRSAEAEALFDRGKALFDVDRLNEACARLEESRRIEPSVGTLGLLAACHEKQGRLVAAFQGYVEAATRAAACGDDREMFAWERAADILLRLPRLRISRADPDAAIELRRGGAVVRYGTIGDALVVDPGRLEILARAKGKIDFVRLVELAEGARVDVDIPALAKAPPPPGAPQAPGSASLSERSAETACAPAAAVQSPSAGERP
jgi:tetratricopeptide (TPR) repeat protein